MNGNNLSKRLKHSKIKDPCKHSQLKLLIILFKLFGFYKLKGRDNPVSSNSLCFFFPTVSAHFVPLCHILAIPVLSQALSSLL